MATIQNHGFPVRPSYDRDNTRVNIIIRRGGGKVVNNIITKQPNFENVPVEKLVQMHDRITKLATRVSIGFNLENEDNNRKIDNYIDDGLELEEIPQVDSNARIRELETDGAEMLLKRIISVKKAIEGVLPAPKKPTHCEKISKHKYFWPVAVATSAILATLLDRLSAKYIY